MRVAELETLLAHLHGDMLVCVGGMRGLSHIDEARKHTRRPLSDFNTRHPADGSLAAELGFYPPVLALCGRALWYEQPPEWSIQGRWPASARAALAALEGGAT